MLPVTNLLLIISPSEDIMADAGPEDVWRNKKSISEKKEGIFAINCVQQSRGRA